MRGDERVQDGMGFEVVECGVQWALCCAAPQLVRAAQADRTKKCDKVRPELRPKTAPELETALQRDAKGASTQANTESGPNNEHNLRERLVG